MVVAGDGGGKLKCLTLRCDIYTPEGSAWLSKTSTYLAVLAVNSVTPSSTSVFGSFWRSANYNIPLFLFVIDSSTVSVLVLITPIGHDMTLSIRNCL